MVKTNYVHGNTAGNEGEHLMPNVQPAFFRNVQSLGAVAHHGGKSMNQLDPLGAAKSKFASAADSQVKLIEASAAKGLWFRREGETIIVTLKNGMAAINREAPSFVLAGGAQAIKFIKAAKEACAKGEFDDLLVATNRVPRKSKDGEATAEAKAQASAETTTVAAAAPALVAAKRSEK